MSDIGSQDKRRGSIVRGFLNVLMFLAGLFGIGAVQTSGLTVPESGVLWRKWEHVEEKGSQYSLVFIGSSRVAHHFIPAQFDEHLKQQGIAVKSFNFGQDGMFPPESFYVLRKLLEDTPLKPRWIVIDVMNIFPVRIGNEETERAQMWHDFHHTMLACKVVMETTRDPEVLLGHLRLFAIRTLGAGRWQRWLQHEMKVVMRKTTAVTKAGYEPLESRPLSKKDAEEFDESVERLKTSTRLTDLAPSYRAEVEALIAYIRSRGAEPVFVLAPDIHASQRFRDWPPSGVAQFSYDHPETYPTLYRKDQRYDSEHLDDEGAKEFTRIFATEFADWLKRK